MFVIKNQVLFQRRLHETSRCGLFTGRKHQTAVDVATKLTIMGFSEEKIENKFMVAYDEQKGVKKTIRSIVEGYFNDKFEQGR